MAHNLRSKKRCELIKADLMSATEIGRHDPDKLCAAVMKIIYSLGGRG
ncbi:MAG: hypothetical protein SR3Q1_08745 [Quinella sp. 3Q1]|nr:hypothetical protein [Quinella sp. 3Q1]MBR3050866.1 hypothetical protein [Selenomonadaceae bacterium]MBR6888618.1 hypothetical protein [Selenomonadaceae bacterium]